MRPLLLMLCGLALLLCCWPTDSRSKPEESPSGLEKRIPWTTSKIVGSPEPPYPYRTEKVFGKVKLDQPTDLEMSPLGDRWIVCEHHGVLKSFANNAEADKAETFLDLRGKHSEHADRQIWSMTFHPKFATNGYIYVCWHETKPSPARCRISRFTLPVKGKETPATCDVSTESIIAEWTAGEDHWGGCLKFGPDGYLYFSAGDGNGYADGFISGQDLSDFQASILRIDVDGGTLLKPYAVPKDNPFVDLKGARPEIWAYGLRNIWKMSFDRKNGDLWGGDVGQDLWDMIYRIEKGGNYGWSVNEGTHPFRPERKVGPTPILPPVVEHDHSESRSITGGFVYHGKALPELVGAYIYGDFDTGKIWAVRYDGRKVTSHVELDDTPLRIVGFAEDNEGELFILCYTGGIYRLQKRPPQPQMTDFPRKLSETGIFASTPEHRVAPGVIPYSVNSPLWSDHAIKDRFMAIPGDGKIGYHPTESWNFPEGSVLVKTFSLETERGNPKTLRRLETRIMHLEQDHWRGYTYVWNDQQTDAELLGKASLEKKYTIHEKAGDREQVWHYPSRAECTLCHTMPVKFVLGLSTPQMNRKQTYGDKTAHQIATLAHIGMFREPLEKSHPKFEGDFSKLAKLADPSNPEETLDRRARSWMQANCAHCHTKWGGGNALFRLNWNLKLDEMGIVGTKPGHGTYDIPDACILKPGQPEKSLLWQRINRTGQGRMPHVGSSVLDETGVKLMKEWITSLK